MINFSHRNVHDYIPNFKLLQTDLLKKNFYYKIYSYYLAINILQNKNGIICTNSIGILCLPFAKGLWIWNDIILAGVHMISQDMPRRRGGVYFFIYISI